MSIEQDQIGALLQAYERALNASDVDAVMALYAEDGVFMPQNSPSSIGTQAIRAAYEAVFGAITLKVKFAIAEIQPLPGGWAFGRTNSAGEVTIHATGLGGPEANQELFVFQNVGGGWKIARYCFCTTNPARG